MHVTPHLSDSLKECVTFTFKGWQFRSQTLFPPLERIWWMWCTSFHFVTMLELWLQSLLGSSRLLQTQITASFVWQLDITRQCLWPSVCWIALDLNPLKMETRTSYSAKQHHIQEEQNPWLQCCKNLKTYKMWQVFEFQWSFQEKCYTSVITNKFHLSTHILAVSYSPLQETLIYKDYTRH